MNSAASSPATAAVSGSSAATCATIGKMTLPELGKRGYPEDITIGSLAGAGTLGLLIPPSIIMIVYGVSADVSIAKLFVAGIIPGVVLASLEEARKTTASKRAAGEHHIPAHVVHRRIQELLAEGQTAYDAPFSTSNFSFSDYDKITRLPYAAMYFNALDRGAQQGTPLSRVRAAYRLSVNEYNGLRSIQLNVEHFE